MKLKRHLLASVFWIVPFAASAADLPVKASPPPVVQPIPFTWTGFYVGLSAGGIGQGATQTDLDGDPRLGFAPGTARSVKGAGGLFGINVGYNYQFAPNWVLGIEADIAASSLNKTNNEFVAFSGCNFGFKSKLNSLGTVRGRIGYAFNRTLIYGTGGFAYGRVQNSVNNNSGKSSQQYSSDKVRYGWTAGGGVEYALTNNWTIRGEVLYVDLGTETAANGSGCRFGFKNTYTLGRIGMNYKF